MLIHGACHCQNIAFMLTVDPAPEKIIARACTCTFCLKHNSIWSASPDWSLNVLVKARKHVHRYQFGTRTAEFHICRICGVVPFATSRIRNRDFAIVNVNTFNGIPAAMISHSSVSFDGEGEGDRLARREKNWIPDVHVAEHNARTDRGTLQE